METQTPTMSGLYRAIRTLVRVLTFGYLRPSIEGVEQIPTTGGAIIAGNHPSVLDGVLLLAVSPRPVRFLVAEDLYTHRFLHPFFRAFGCIPVLRRQTHNGDALSAAVAALERGEVIGIFPEGTTHHGGVMREIKRGVALLAMKTGVPVVPLAIRGTREAFPDGAKVPKPWPVQLTFSAPITYPKVPEALIPEPELAAAMEDIRLRVVDLMVRQCGTPMPDVARTLFEHARTLAASLIVLPLSGLLTMTANPSLDPARRHSIGHKIT